MYTNIIGNTHNANQDFLIGGEKFGIVADGCSGCEYSEVGTRLVLQLYDHLKDKDDPSKFEENIKKVIDGVINMFKSYEHDNNLDGILNSFVVNNMLFTLLACFETKDEFIVYTLGDGYIITRNIFGDFSYIHIDYENQPPYILYNYMKNKNGESLCNIPFKVFKFKKSLFNGVGVASDGITPIVEEMGSIGTEGRVKFESYLSRTKLSSEKQSTIIKNFISKLYRQEFYDDVSLIFLEDTSNAI